MTSKLSSLLFGGRAAKVIRDSDIPRDYPRRMMLCHGKQYFTMVELHGRVFGGAFLCTMLDAPKQSQQHNYARTPQLFAVKILRSHNWQFVGQSRWRGNVLRHIDGSYLQFHALEDEVDATQDEGESWNWNDNPQESLRATHHSLNR